MNLNGERKIKICLLNFLEPSLRQQKVFQTLVDVVTLKELEYLKYYLYSDLKNIIRTSEDFETLIRLGVLKENGEFSTLYEIEDIFLGDIANDVLEKMKYLRELGLDFRRIVLLIRLIIYGGKNDIEFIKMHLDEIKSMSYTALKIFTCSFEIYDQMSQRGFTR